MTNTNRPQPTATSKVAAFGETELSMSRMWAAQGKTYPGRVTLFPEDPWGELAGSADTLDPWWVQEDTDGAISTALSAVVPWDVAVEFDPTDYTGDGGPDYRGTWTVLVFDADGTEVVPEQQYDASIRADMVVASMLNLLNAAR